MEPYNNTEREFHLYMQNLIKKILLLHQILQFIMLNLGY